MDSSTRVVCKLLGVEVSSVSRDELFRWLELGRKASSARLVVGHNLHSAYLAHTDPVFAAAYARAEIVLADGRPVQLDAARSARLLRRAAVIPRLGTTDWLPQYVARAEQERVLIVGADAEANDAAVARLIDAAPALEVRGIPGAGWSVAKAERVLSEIHAWRPTLTVIGLGMPLQEHFILSVWDRLPPGSYALVGGAIDQIAGTQTLAPRWLGKFGVEWLWRLLSNPRRLWHRYLIEPWILASIRVRAVRKSSGTTPTRSGGEQAERSSG